MYKKKKYKLAKNHVNNKISKQYLIKKKSYTYCPFKYKLFICQLNTPGIIVKLHSDNNKPVCSNKDNLCIPPIILKSDKPEYLSIKIPNHIKVIALLQQQKININKDSSK